MLFTTIPAISQVRLGFSLDSIMKEYPIDENQGMIDTMKNGNAFYAITTEYAYIFYYCDQYKNCDMVQIIPLNSGFLNAFAESYNKKYTIISNQAWKAYLPQIIADVTLEYPDDEILKTSPNSKPSFFWVFAKE
jgi:hypothetical protein